MNRPRFCAGVMDEFGIFHSSEITLADLDIGHDQHGHLVVFDHEKDCWRYAMR